MIDEKQIAFPSYKDAMQSAVQYKDSTIFNNLCTYGIKPLDHALLAMAKNELVVIAAGSGYGKTEMALAISRHNAIRGRKVAHFNLEGGSREAIMRLMWRDMCDIYYREYSEEGVEMDFRKWFLNYPMSPLIKKLENQAYVEMSDKLGGNMWLYENPGGLDCDTFCKAMVNLEGLSADLSLDRDMRLLMTGLKGIDLIVIDHLHYFNIDKDDNEIAEITEILKRARIITEELQIPIILVAHLRKLMRGHGVPDKEDIYGTSNIHKIASTCIIIAPDHEKDRGWEGIYPTYMRIAKSRQGIRPNDLIYVDFNIKTRSYSEKYEIYKGFPDGSVTPEPVPEGEKPRWAR